MVELVYLWVKGYKNIHKQGFKFSPRFNCAYDDVKNELTIDENDDYIPDFFGDNINVTAIVGKNGSGKSNILKFIRLFLTKDISILNNYKGFLLFIDKDDKFYIYTNPELSSKIEKLKNIEKIFSGDISSFTKIHNTVFPLFDYSLTFENLLTTNESNDLQHILFPVFPKKKFGIIDFNIELRKKLMVIGDNYKQLKKANKLDIFESFFQPKKIQVFINFDMFDSEKNSKLKNIKVSQKTKILELKTNAIKSLESNEHKEAIESIDKIFKIIWDISNYDNKPEKINFLPKELINYNYNQNLLLICKSLCKNNSYKDFKRNTFNRYSNFQQIFGWNIDDIDNIELFSGTFIYPYFDIAIIDNYDKELSSLSFGEQQLIGILNQIYYLGTKEYIPKNKTADIPLKIKNYIILLDEIDISFHPDWQKRILRYIIDFLELIPDKTFYLIFTTHSPFLLSDIPKQNIIFLDKDENGNCKVVDGLKEKKETFGANIHTLLSDSFFMEEGLMGEFAKGKIDRAIKLLNQERLDDNELKYCEEIISIIGEPIVKNQLQRMLDSKRLSKIDAVNEKIKNMSYELEILKEHQTKIVQDELRNRGKKQYKQRLKDD